MLMTHDYEADKALMRRLLQWDVDGGMYGERVRRFATVRRIGPFAADVDAVLMRLDAAFPGGV